MALRHGRFRAPMQLPWECSKEKCFVIILVQYELVLSTISDLIGSDVSSQMTWTLLSVLISSGYAGSVMSFGWMKTLLREECLMLW